MRQDAGCLALAQKPALPPQTSHGRGWGDTPEPGSLPEPCCGIFANTEPAQVDFPEQGSDPRADLPHGSRVRPALGSSGSWSSLVPKLQQNPLVPKLQQNPLVPKLLRNTTLHLSPNRFHLSPNRLGNHLSPRPVPIHTQTTKNDPKNTT
jgi:hypothetical protein